MTAPPYDELPSAENDRLNRLLERWAAPRRLTDAQAEAVRASIVSPPEILGNEWWQKFFGQMRETLRRSHETAQSGSMAGPHVLPSVFPGWTGISVKSENYRAYVRMT
jgi:hypothetical protein